jgi:hypothetical protein
MAGRRSFWRSQVGLPLHLSRPGNGNGFGQRGCLAQARDRAAKARKLVAAGVNPIEARREAGRIAAGKPTFGRCADALLAAKASEWRNEKHRAQWAITLETYAAPLRGLPVDEVDTEAVLGVLQPLWQAKPETASRLRGRIETVLDAARAKGHIARNEANPARWRGHLDKLLPKRQKLTRGHHAAMDYRGVGGFIGKLREREACAALALEFLTLTAARSGEVLGSRWAEFDLEGKVWTVPAARMKAGRASRAALKPGTSDPRSSRRGEDWRIRLCRAEGWQTAFRHGDGNGAAPG